MSDDVVTTTLEIQGIGKFIHIYAPILAGRGIRTCRYGSRLHPKTIWSTVVRQQILIFAIFRIIGAHVLAQSDFAAVESAHDYTHSFASRDFDPDVGIPWRSCKCFRNNRRMRSKTRRVVHQHEAEAEGYLNDL